MRTDEPIDRRRLLRLTGGLAAMGLAGCVGARTDGTQTIAAPSNDRTETHGEPAGDADHVEADGHGHEDGGHGHEGTPEGHTPDGDPHAHEDAGHMHDEAVGEPIDRATVRMTNTADGFHFDPHVARVHVGGTVAFVNESGAHSATAYHPDNGDPLRMPEGATPFDSGLLADAGAEFEHTFETEGVYQYYCIPHEAMGMIGAVIVGEPDAHGQPGLEPPGPAFSGRAAEKIEELNAMCNEALGHVHD